LSRRTRLLGPRSLNDGQTLAATQAAALEYGSTGGGQHALQKAMLTLARDALGLVRPLGHGKQVLGGAEPGRLGESKNKTAASRRAGGLGDLAPSISTPFAGAPKNRTGARLLHKRETLMRETLLNVWPLWLL
jgi:hypothetical protein